jgi:hypothetical protein
MLSRPAIAGRFPSPEPNFTQQAFHTAPFQPPQNANAAQSRLERTTMESKNLAQRDPRSATRQNPIFRAFPANHAKNRANRAFFGGGRGCPPELPFRLRPEQNASRSQDNAGTEAKRRRNRGGTNAGQSRDIPATAAETPGKPLTIKVPIFRVFHAHSAFIFRKKSPLR